MTIKRSRGPECFICLEGNEVKPFKVGPFCPSEGNYVKAYLDLIGDKVSLTLTGKHGHVHSDCLSNATMLDPRCPMCRLPMIENNELDAQSQIQQNIQEILRIKNMMSGTEILAAQQVIEDFEDESMNHIWDALINRMDANAIPDTVEPESLASFKNIMNHLLNEFLTILPTE